jgi:hypothetical protein
MPAPGSTAVVSTTSITVPVGKCAMRKVSGRFRNNTTVISPRGAIHNSGAESAGQSTRNSGQRVA